MEFYPETGSMHREVPGMKYIISVNPG